MGRPPVPPKIDGRYGYTAPRPRSDPPPGLERRNRTSEPPASADQDLSFPPAPIVMHHRRREPTSSGPGDLSKQLKAKIVIKLVEWGLALVGVAVAGAFIWLTTRASTSSVEVVSAACTSASAMHQAREHELEELIVQERRDRVDAGFAFGESLNRQDAINKHVWDITRKKRDETGPPPVGPRALQEGRQ